MVPTLRDNLGPTPALSPDKDTTGELVPRRIPHRDRSAVLVLPVGREGAAGQGHAVWTVGS